MSNARTKYGEGDEEGAFILYHEAVQIHEIITKKMDEKFKRSIVSIFIIIDLKFKK